MSTDNTAPGAGVAPFILGSFVFQEPPASLPDGDPVRVVGQDGTPFAGRSGIARTVSVATTPDAQAATEVLLAKLRHLTHPALASVLESGITGSTAWWVHALPDGSLLELPDPQNAWPIRRAQQLVSRIGGALQLAHELGLSHGAIGPETLFVPADGSFVLIGLGPAGKGAAQDQRDLAALAIALLAGKPWSEPQTDRSRCLRELLSGLTERVSTVLSRATDPDPSARFPDMSAFVAAFDDAIRMSAEDLVHGAFEAISARSPEMAQLIADRAAAYDPNCEGLSLLKLQLRGGSPFGDFAPANTLNLAVEPPSTPPSESAFADVVPAAVSAPLRHSFLPPELTEGLPQELLDTIAPQFDVKPVKKGMNPLFVLILGGAGVVLLLAIAGVATMLMSGS